MEHVLVLAAELGIDKELLYRKTSDLSGGMQRRLSVAISLTGDPKIVFLGLLLLLFSWLLVPYLSCFFADEPTSGLDITSRRNLWEVISKHKANKCIILTTHSMDEADTLCNRIGIIAKGKLQCLGNQVHLKSKVSVQLFVSFANLNRSF